MKDVTVVPNKSSNADEFISAMLHRTQNNRELAVTLIKKLMLQLPKQIEAIDSAIKTGNSTLAKNIAHDLHGSVAFCGFNAMQNQAEILEKKLIAKQFNAINEHILLLKTMIKQFLLLEQEIIDALS